MTTATPISALPSAGRLDRTESIPLVQTGTTKKIAVSDLFGAILASDVATADGLTAQGKFSQYDAAQTPAALAAAASASLAASIVLGLPYFPYPLNAGTSASGTNILPQGITTGTVGGTAIAGATVGTYALTPVGGNFTGVVANLVVTSATAATIQIVNPGRTTSASPTAPTWANPTGATIPAGTTLTANIGAQIGTGSNPNYTT
jgi:hypothetical protein